MAHNLHIDERTGEAALFLLKEPAWHGLGQVVQEAKTSEEVLKIAHLDWEVEKVKTFVHLTDTHHIETGSYSTIRTDTNRILGNGLGSKYTPVQNARAFEFLDSLGLDKEDIEYHTAGALYNGGVVFISAKLPTYMVLPGEDLVNQYILFSNFHDRYSKIQIRFTNVRIVCNNTLNMAFKSPSRVSWMHTPDVENKMQLGRDVLGMRMIWENELAEALTHLSKVKVSDDNIENILSDIFLTDFEREIIDNGDLLSTRRRNQLSDIMTSIKVAPGQNLHEGSALWVFNGITSYLQNVKTYKNMDRKMWGLMYDGDESILSQKTMKYLLTNVI